jgi:hypothetical protein
VRRMADCTLRVCSMPVTFTGKETTNYGRACSPVIPAFCTALQRDGRHRQQQQQQQQRIQLGRLISAAQGSSCMRP